MLDRKHFLALLHILYQGLNLMAKGIKRLIEEIKTEQSSQV